MVAIGFQFLHIALQIVAHQLHPASKFDQGLRSLPGQFAANLGVAHDGAYIAEEFLDFPQILSILVMED